MILKFLSLRLYSLWISSPILQQFLQITSRRIHVKNVSEMVNEYITPLLWIPRVSRTRSVFRVKSFLLGQYIFHQSLSSNLWLLLQETWYQLIYDMLRLNWIWQSQIVAYQRKETIVFNGVSIQSSLDCFNHSLWIISLDLWTLDVRMTNVWSSNKALKAWNRNFWPLSEQSLVEWRPSKNMFKRCSDTLTLFVFQSLQP